MGMKKYDISVEGSQTLHDDGCLRIHSITKVLLEGDKVRFVTMPLTYGVSIEWKYNGKNYIVISFVESNEKGRIYTHPVNKRVADFCCKDEANKALYNKVKAKARRIVKGALIEHEEA